MLLACLSFVPSLSCLCAGLSRLYHILLSHLSVKSCLVPPISCFSRAVKPVSLSLAAFLPSICLFRSVPPLSVSPRHTRLSVSLRHSRRSVTLGLFLQCRGFPLISPVLTVFLGLSFCPSPFLSTHLFPMSFLVHHPVLLVSLFPMSVPPLLVSLPPACAPPRLCACTQGWGTDTCGKQVEGCRTLLPQLQPDCPANYGGLGLPPSLLLLY